MCKAWINYFKDNPNGYWFKRKLFGYGWVPVTWQGWLVSFVFLALVLWQALEMGENPSPEEAREFTIFVVISIVVFIAICAKNGEKPKWQWGLPAKYKKK